MGLIGALVAIHPKAWRDRYGDEFTALLEDTPLSPRVVADVLASAARLRAVHHRQGLSILATLFVSLGSAAVAHATVPVPNLVWLPRSVPSALLLLGVLGPWFVLGTALIARRTQLRRRTGL